MHGPVCPCCAPRRGAGVGAVFDLLCGLLFVVAVAAGRFLSGRPLLRQVGSLDATYLAWAPAVPMELAVLRVVAPRTRWGRRPGYQRQLVRLAVVAVGAAFLVAPVVTVAALAGAVATGVVARVAWPRQAIAPAGPATAVPLGPVAARTGVRGPRWDGLSRREHDEQDWSDPAAWMGASVPVRAQARRMDRGGAW